MTAATTVSSGYVARWPKGAVRAFYRSSEEIALVELPTHTTTVRARRASGELFEAEGDRDAARFSGLPTGTYAFEALSAEGDLLAEELTTVASHPGEMPVHGFTTSFEDDDVPGVLDWLQEQRCTVVQVYDWMSTYSAPLGPPEGWKDPSGRPVSFQALRKLARGIRDQGGVAHAYAPVYAVDLAFAAANPQLLTYRGDGQPERLFDQIQLADPGNPDWQRHFVATYGRAADEIGFGGFHLDTYGFPRAALDVHGHEVDLRKAYLGFLEHVRRARPADLLSFNQVNGVPSGLPLAGEPCFRYCEVWPPNDGWRHLEALMDRSAAVAGRLGSEGGERGGLRGTIACYPPVWESSRGDAQRGDRLRTVVLTEAIATCLGAGALLYGDRRAALCDPYYPKHERLHEAEAQTALAWHRFALRHRDLFLDGEDTSWYEIGDENGAIAVLAEVPVRPEPVGGGLFARVVHGEDRISVGVLDLTGSACGSWSEPTGPGRCRSARVRVLVAVPEHWTAALAVLGQHGGRFVPASSHVVEHREGLALEVELPLVSGWSVLRLVRRVGAGPSAPAI